MIKPVIYTSGKVIDHIDEIIDALKRQDTVTWVDVKLNKPVVVVQAQNSMGRRDVMVPNGVGLTNIQDKNMFDGSFELKIGQQYK